MEPFPLEGTTYNNLPNLIDMLKELSPVMADEVTAAMCHLASEQYQALGVVTTRLIEAAKLGGSNSPSKLPAIVDRINVLEDFLARFDKQFDAKLGNNAILCIASTLQREAEKGLLNVGQSIAAVDALIDLIPLAYPSKPEMSKFASSCSNAAFIVISSFFFLIIFLLWCKLNFA
jgi:hypothetical protein